MASVKCQVCANEFDSSFTGTCPVCGQPLENHGQRAEQPNTGFSQQASDGFGAAAQTKSGFGQSSGFGLQNLPSFGVATLPTSGFGQAQSGYGQQGAAGFGQATNGFGQKAQNGFGQQVASGFVQQAPNGFGGQTGFGTQSVVLEPDAYDRFDSSVESAIPKERTAATTRFVETLSKEVEDSVYWGTKECLFFMLKGLIPIYGLILFILCLLGNQRKYPKVITNYLRAGIIFTVIMCVLLILLTLGLGIGAVNTMKSLGGY